MGNVYNEKYRVLSVESKTENPLHDGVREASFCHMAYLNPGERGWFLYIDRTLVGDFAHRIHTSIIEDVVYDGDKIIVKTMNTVYTFELMREE